MLSEFSWKQRDLGKNKPKLNIFHVCTRNQENFCGNMFQTSGVHRLSMIAAMRWDRHASQTTNHSLSEELSQTRPVYAENTSLTDTSFNIYTSFLKITVCNVRTIGSSWNTIITGWAVALTCYVSHSAKHRKMVDFDPSGSQNPQTDFNETWHGWLCPRPHPTWQLW